MATLLPPTHRARRRTLRTLAQLVVSSGFTALVATLASGLSPAAAAAVLACSQLAVTWAQNKLEEMGVVPILLPEKGRATGRP